MNLSTNYLGFDLPHPLICGAGPLAHQLDAVKRLEDAGCPLVVVHSLFEEQIKAEEIATTRAIEAAEEQSGEATSYLPKPEAFKLGPDDYLEHIRKLKKQTSMKVVGSLNGTTPGGWLDYAKLIEQAGADALELNLYELATDVKESGAAVEKRAIEVVRAVKKAVRLPVAVKLSPFYSSMANFAMELDKLGVDGLVVFNRFYQPDIDVEALEVLRVNLSSSAELSLRLRWLAILSGKIRASLAVTGGVHTVVDTIKSVMAGAHAVQMVSALLHNGPRYLAEVRQGMEAWMDKHEYESLKQMQGSMNLMRCPDPKIFERANYMHILNSWQS